MVINTTGVELTPPAEYIKAEGKYVFKIEKWELDGFNNEGTEKFKIHFKAFAPTDTSTIYNHSENFSLQQNMLWKIKQLEVALKSPEIYEIESWLGRYVVGTVKMHEHNGKQYANIKEYEYSKHNDKLPPIPTAEQNTNDVPTVDIDTDEIPF